MVDLGFNYRLTDLQCALGWSQVNRLRAFIERRRWIAKRYLEAFADLPELRCPIERPDVQSGWHLFVVRVQGEPSRRLPFFEALRREGLGVQVHYLPVYRHPYYEDLGFRAGLCPVAEDFYARAVTLPLFPKMSNQDVDRVIEVVHQVAAKVL
jgi:dTDP-4-amino-4,6-dideoxygalactose transaminase